MNAMSGITTGDKRPYRHLIVPWIKRPAQRFILRDWLAITIGSTIISWRQLDPVELAHEVAHVGQWKRHGLRFIPRYLLASRAAQRAGRDRYRDNVFEVEAREAEEAVRRSLQPM